VLGDASQQSEVVGGGESSEVTFESELPEDCRRWAFALFHPSPTHTAALCVESSPKETVRLRIFEARPRKEYPFLQKALLPAAALRASSST